jgi:hypothetical protein
MAMGKGPMFQETAKFPGPPKIPLFYIVTEEARVKSVIDKTIVGLMDGTFSLKRRRPCVHHL